MKDSKQILDQISPKITLSQSSSATGAGHHNSHASQDSSIDRIDTINECFELLRINYQHLYLSAYREKETLNSAKRLWLESLSAFEPSTISRAMQNVIKQSDYLPTISRMIKICTEISTGHTLPAAHAAYQEACNAPSPKAYFSWSHPAVYYAGKASNWHFLASTDEHIAFPVFKEQYQLICQQLVQGETLPQLEAGNHNTQEITTPLTKQDNIKRLQTLREALDI